MLVMVLSCAVVGLDGALVQVEVDLANGLPAFTIVGLPDAAVNEAKNSCGACGSRAPPPGSNRRVEMASGGERKDTNAKLPSWSCMRWRAPPMVRTVVLSAPTRNAGAASALLAAPASRGCRESSAGQVLPRSLQRRSTRRCSPQAGRANPPDASQSSLERRSVGSSCPACSGR